jgi:non-specific serine/threonine protein kinase
VIPTGKAPSLHIRLFGPFEARLNDQPLARLRFHKSQSVLALLALRRGTPAERRWLAGLLWPDRLDAQMLRNCLSDLRRALGPQADRLTCPTPQSLALDLSRATVDVLAFDEAIARGDLSSLEAAVALRRGALLEGCSEEWAFQERQPREQAFLAALEKLAALALEREEVAAAERHLRRAVATDPLRESAQRALMALLATSGNFAAALLVYRELRLHLHRELNVEPDAETQTLFQQLRGEARRLGAKGTGAMDPWPGARFRLAASGAGRDLPLPEPQPLRTPAHNLPLQLTSFIGREEQIAAVRRRLPTHRLVTLTGAGGCGKTRLALRVASDLPAKIPHGVWLVELASLADPSLVPQAAAAALGVQEQPGRPAVEALVEALRPKQLLLVLDNCEHLVAACAGLSETLLQACPGLRILATSREPLGVPGELLYRVPSLSLPPLVDGQWSGTREAGGVDGSGKSRPADPSTINHQPSTLLQFEAIRLFAERAESALSSFAITGENAAAVAQVCQRLDGIPLAIELAAARVKAMPVEKLAERLDDVFRLLTGGSRTALPRHRTLRALIDWSYDLLSEPEQALLRRLSVFAGGWTLETAEAVCGDPIDGGWSGTREAGGVDGSAGSGPSTINDQPSTHEVLDLLTSLVEKSLVIYEEKHGARYRLLETVRQYARDRLLAGGAEGAHPPAAGTRPPQVGAGPGPGGEGQAIRSRHAAFFLQLAEQAEPALWGADQVLWFDRLETEHDNLRTALEWLVHSSEAEGALRLAGALRRLWSVRGCCAEGRRRLVEVLALPGATEHPAARAAALYAAGILAAQQGDCEAARSLYEQSLALRRQLGDKEGTALSLIYLGQILVAQGDHPAAHAVCEESLALGREMQDKSRIAFSLHQLGQVAFFRGDYQGARAFGEESLTLRRELGDKHYIAFSLDGLADVARCERNYSLAHTLYTESLSLRRELADQHCIATSLHNLGQLSREQGLYEEARSFYLQSLAMRREHGERLSMIECLEGLAGVLVAWGQAELAARWFGTTAAAREALGSPLPPHKRTERARDMASLKDLMGEEGLAAAWAEGRALPLDQVVAAAFGGPDSSLSVSVPQDSAHLDRAVDYPRLTSAPAPDHNLPLALTRFIGREREIAAVKELLGGGDRCSVFGVRGKESDPRPNTEHRTPDARLLTLTGAGGSGKTRLGLQVAAGLLEAYPDGVWLVELAPLAEHSLVLPTTAAALGVREQPGRPLAETLVEALKPRRLLLVLDNCEHLVAACARLAETLLKACPGLRILATSREPLGVPGETTYRVPSLSLPSLVDGRWLIVDGPAQRATSQSLPEPSTINHQPSTLMQSEAVCLFVERAEDAACSFALTPENATAIAEICCRLDGIPLAIELAAARVKALPVGKLAERLDDMFRLLTSGSRTALPRHQTLRALIDWSYDLLSEPEQALLRRLSVFAGGWTLETAEAVCGGSVDGGWSGTREAGGVDGSGGWGPSTINDQPSTHEVLDLLAALVDKSLVLYGEPAAPRGAGAAEPRYRLLETVRQYGRDRLLEAGEEAEVRKRHLSYFLALAEEAEAKLGSAEKRVWLERLESEHDNLRAALAWSLSEAGDSRMGLRLAGALWWFWLLHDHRSEGREWLERALARSDADQPSPARAKVLEGAGFLTSDRRLGEESVALFRELGDPLGLASSLRTLGFRLTEWGDLAAARTVYEESLAICQQQGDRWGLIPSLWGLGHVAFRQNEYASAQSLWEECVRVSREAGDQWNCAWALDGLGRVAQRLSDWGAARAYYKEGLSLFRDLGNQWGIVYGLSHLAQTAGGGGHPERAARLFGAVEAMLAPIGERPPAHDLVDADRQIAAARAALGGEAFAAAWRAGGTLTQEQAIAEALQEDRDPGD